MDGDRRGLEGISNVNETSNCESSTTSFSRHHFII